MSLKRIYTCDLCREEITDGKGAGVYWDAPRAGAFTLIPMENTDFEHLCTPCLLRLRDLLQTWTGET